MHPEACGIFPPINDQPERDWMHLLTGDDHFAKYSWLEGNPVALDEISEHIQAGHIRPSKSLDAVQSFVGGPVVLSKIGIITRTRANRATHRMILDTNQSDLKKCSVKAQRVLLPRLLDVVVQSLCLQSKCTVGEDIEWLVLDFSKAIPTFITWSPRIDHRCGPFIRDTVRGSHNHRCGAIARRAGQ